jgi:biopolymer transport protein TolR
MARRKLASEINVVPYIDVMLVLLIIFMVTAPLLTQGVQVDLPDANAQSMTSSEEDKVVSINSKGEIFVSWSEPERALGDDDLVEKVTAMMHAKPEAMILVQGDAKVPYERVALALTLLQQSGAKKIGFVTQPADTPRRPAESEKKR